MNSYAVTWQRKPIALPFLIDVDSLEMAAEIAIRLHSVPQVYEVRITTLEGAEMDAETRSRIWNRIQERINSDWATGVMR